MIFLTSKLEHGRYSGHEHEYHKLTSRKDYEQFIDHPLNSINHYTIGLKAMPSWYVGKDLNSAFIHEGYRRFTKSWRGCLLSLTYIHNETGNIFTHMIGALMILPLAVWLVNELNQIDTITGLDYIVHASYLFGLFCCLSSSTIFHLCCCHSHSVSKMCNKGLPSHTLPF